MSFPDPSHLDTSDSSLLGDLTSLNIDISVFDDSLLVDGMSLLDDLSSVHLDNDKDSIPAEVSFDTNPAKAVALQIINDEELFADDFHAVARLVPHDDETPTEVSFDANADITEAVAFLYKNDTVARMLQLENEIPPLALFDINIPETVACSQKEPIVPREIDILQGRGRDLRKHPGNIYFRELVTSHYREYCKCSRKKEKTVLFMTIVAAQRESRFLKSTHVHGETVWEELTIEEAREKVAMTFRNVTKKKRRLARNCYY